jgi:uncharacterized protein (DUF2147 family)
MKCIQKIGKLIIVTSVFFITNTYAENSPVGYWKTIDDITGKPKSIVKIYRNQDQTLAGQVVKLYPSSDKEKHTVCIACSGNKHNQPIVGMVILSGLKSSSAQWGDGNILDPHNGKTYNCSAKLAENGKRLTVRGYIGLPLLGRSQTWERVDLMSES